MVEDNVAPPGNQAETENTNIDLQRWEKLIYSTPGLIRKVFWMKVAGAWAR
jgi:hypothetical protein